ncbi:MAG: ABC transporter ATP-binding protein, partial [Actinomycetota bacterium]|nr:ABC transporter ATP-binding protein [Actinomycetota bacterium]
MALLEVENIHSYYGHIHALRGVSLRVDEGEVVTLIGSNGAGKTTTLRSIHGILAPREGRIVFRGEEIQGKPAHGMIKKGIAQSPEGRRIFSRMSVHENLEMGAYHRSDRDGIQEDMERVYDLFPRLKERVKQEAGTMSGGEQQMLAIGRALMSRPKLLLLDEPSMGLAPVLVERIFQTVEEINKQGTTILLVEQNANVALEVATRGYVLEAGTIVNAAPAEKLREDPKV